VLRARKPEVTRVSTLVHATQPVRSQQHFILQNSCFLEVEISGEDHGQQCSTACQWWQHGGPSAIGALKRLRSRRQIGAGHYHVPACASQIRVCGRERKRFRSQPRRPQNSLGTDRPVLGRAAMGVISSSPYTAHRVFRHRLLSRRSPASCRWACPGTKPPRLQPTLDGRYHYDTVHTAQL
jgi:hypothetical protein